MAAEKEISRENFDPIWSFIEGKLNESVPKYIKYVLSYCGYNNGITIASIEDDDINYCVKEVRSGNVISYYKSKIGDKDVLEGCTKTWQDFEFSRGHLKYLMDIVAMLKNYMKENGSVFTIGRVSQTKQRKSKLGSKTRMRKISSISPKNRRANYYAMTNSKIDAENPLKRHARILVSKMVMSLRTHTPVLYAEIAQNINIKITELIVVEESKIKTLCENKSSHESESEQMTEKQSEDSSEGLTEENSEESTAVNSEELAVEELQKYTASMLCPYCWKSINVFFVDTSGSPRWNSSNFDRHLKLVHRTQATETTENDSGSEDEWIGKKAEVARGGSKTQNAEISNEPEGARDGSKTQVARDGSKTQVARCGNKTQVVGASRTGQYANIGNESESTGGLTQNQVARCAKKAEDSRIGNKGEDTNIGNGGGARGVTKNKVARGVKKAEEVRVCTDVIEIMDTDTEMKSQGARRGYKFQDASGGNNTQVARVGNKTQDAIISNKSEGARGGRKGEDPRDSEGQDDNIENESIGGRGGTENRHACVGNIVQDGLICQDVRDDPDLEESETEYEVKKEQIGKSSITRKMNMSKVVREQTCKIANEAVEKNGGNNSVMFPKEGDYIICSKPIENSEKWPEDTPVMKNFVGRVIRIKDIILEDAAESVDNGRIPVEIELQFLKKHPHAKHIFIIPDAITIDTIATNRILKILQTPTQNRRGDVVFKDKALLDYIF